MGNNPSVLKCLPESEDAKKLKWLEERCTQLAIENERLHQKVREAQLTTQGGSLHGGSALTLDNAPAASSPMLTRRDTSSTSNMTEMAVSAAAEATAQYQRSLVRVEVDNETEPGVATIVTVRAPDRPYLLGDMTGALLGLGLAVRQAAIAKVDGMESTASLQCSLQDGGRAITEEKRLQSIEQRLQQRFCGRQGLNGGVRRLVVERFLRAEPPWTHEALEPLAPPADSQALWLKSLGLALGPRGSSAQFMGADSTALAARCAAEILPEMIRMRLPPGCTVGREQTSDEWLLLLESDATVVQAAPGSKSPAARRLSGGGGGGASRDSSPRVGLGLTGLGSPATRGGGGGVRPPAPRLPGLRGLGGGSGVGSEEVAPPSGRRPHEGERIVLKAGSVLFEKIIPSAPLSSHTTRATGAARPQRARPLRGRHQSTRVSTRVSCHTHTHTNTTTSIHYPHSHTIPSRMTVEIAPTSQHTGHSSPRHRPRLSNDAVMPDSLHRLDTPPTDCEEFRPIPCIGRHTHMSTPRRPALPPLPSHARRAPPVPRI